MDRIFIIAVGIALGGLGYYVYEQQQAPDIVASIATVEAPQLTSILQVAENRSANSVLVVKKGLGLSNNAVFLLQWLYKSRVGVDFTGFDWASLDGVNAPYGTEPVVISGELPALLPMGAGEVTSEQEEVISKIMGYDEKGKMRPVAKARQPIVNDCTRDILLYDAEVLAHAKDAVEQLFSVAAPRNAQGAPMVTFDLTFANEEELRKEIAKRANQDVSCGGVIYIDAN